MYTKETKKGYVSDNVFWGNVFGNLGTVCFDGSKGLVSEDVMI